MFYNPWLQSSQHDNTCPCTARDTSYLTQYEGNVLFKDALNTFYLRLYSHSTRSKYCHGIVLMGKCHSLQRCSIIHVCSRYNTTTRVPARLETQQVTWQYEVQVLSWSWRMPGTILHSAITENLEVAITWSKGHHLGFSYLLVLNN